MSSKAKHLLGAAMLIVPILVFLYNVLSVYGLATVLHALVPALEVIGGFVWAITALVLLASDEWDNMT